MIYNTSSNPWIQRLNSSTKAFKAWEDKFACRRLNDYYENFQWRARTDGPQINYRPYTLNLFHSTIKIKLASFLFQKPEFMVSPEPGHAHWDLDFAVQSAQLKQDTLNTIIKNKNIKFAKHLKYTAIDSFFWFSMMEVGYAADWRNPLKEDPYLNTWDDPSISEDKVKKIGDEPVPINERFFVKRIKPWRFRVSISDAEDLEDHEWVGYWQYYYVDTLKKTPGIKFPKNWDGGGFSVDDIGSYTKDSQRGLYLSQVNDKKVCKCWHIWDQVSKERKLILDGYDNDDYELWSQPFERLPLIDNRWDLRLEGFYPIPPAWYWLSSQDEINEAREQRRSYRRRFTRKFYALKGAVDEEEVEKFVSGPDGVVVEFKNPDAIGPIANPEFGPTTTEELTLAINDFQISSGTSAEVRDQGDRETATQAKITDSRSQIRESAEQLDFSEFVNLIGREILCQAQEKLVEGLWIKYTTGPGNILEATQYEAPVYKYIKAQDLSDGYDFEVNVDVKNMTPAAMAAEQTAFINFNALLTQFPHLAMDPDLIREAAYRVGYKNERIIHKMQGVAVLAMAAKASMAANTQGMTLGDAASGANTNNTAQAQMATPDLSTIGTQITNQLQ